MTIIGEVDSCTMYLCEPLQFKITISNEELQEIEPREVKRNDRTVSLLQRGWTDLIVKKIWVIRKLPCPFTFKKHYFPKTLGKPYFIFNGKCNHCGATIRGECLEKPIESNPLVIQIDTFDTRGIDHQNKKRNLAHKERTKAKDFLKFESAMKFKHRRANEIIEDDDDVEPPFLHTTVVYNRARQEAKDEEIGVQDWKGDMISKLQQLKRTSPNFTIRIESLPFKFSYFSENQLRLWKLVSEKNLTVAIDASGRFVKPFEIDGCQNPAVFMYNVVITFGSKIYTLCQMLSNGHDTVTIADWLFNWVQNGAPIPKKIVCDSSYALLNAICLAFMSTFHKDYLEQLFLLVTKQSDYTPRCLVKRDRSHLVHSISRWKCFENENVIHKDFYTRSIAYSLEIEDLSLLKEVMISLFVVSQSHVIDEGSECCKRYTWLLEKIETFDHKKYNEEGIGCTDETCYLLNEKRNSSKSLLEFVDNLKRFSITILHSEEKLNFAEPNGYYLPGIVKHLEELYSEFPSFTNVANKFYDEVNPDIAPTSSSCEINFRIMRREYGFKTPKSIDRFLSEHMNLIEGGTKLGLVNFKTMPSPVIENQIKKSVEIEKEVVPLPSYLEKRDLVKNGNVLPPVNFINNSSSLLRLEIKNTCPFDSIYEIFVTACEENEIFRADMENISSRYLFMKAVVDYVVDNYKSTKQIYTLRAKIAYESYNVVENVVNCLDNAGEALQKFFTSFPSTLIETKCTKCLYETRREIWRTFIDVSEYYEIGIKELQSTLNEILNDKRVNCPDCEKIHGFRNKNAKQAFVVNNYLAIDVEYVHQNCQYQFHIRRMSNPKLLTYVTKLCDIPTKINLKNKIYELKGVVCFHPGHYYSYVLTKENKWILFNDILHKATTIYESHLIEEKVSLIIYVVSDGHVIL